MRNMEFQLKASILFFLQVIALTSVFAKAKSQDIDGRMFISIRGANCVRLLNGTHQRGCSSKLFGSVGALHLIQVVEDFEFILRNPPSPPYAPIIPPHLFTRKNLMRLKNEGQNYISVVLLINDPDKMTYFSHELTCPNQYSGILLPGSKETATCDTKNAEKSWNPWGTGLMHEDFPFPIYYVSDEEEIEKLIKCFDKFNNFDYDGHAKRSLCAVEVKAFMTAAVNSEVCWRRSNYVNNLSIMKYCDPLGDYNVYATLYPRNNTQVGGGATEEHSSKINPNEKFILISCRMDTTSMFETLGLGAKDSLSGYITLMSLANTLKQYLPTNYTDLTRKINILFVVFNGESYDYIGSQRFVYDMENLEIPNQPDKLPISFENIELMIDIGTLDETTTINVHTLNATEKIKTFTSLLNTQGQNFNVSFELNAGINLPPTSAQSFLRKMPKFPALILNAKPTNKYYHSIYDDAANVNFTYGNYTEQNYTKLMTTEEALKYFTADSIQIKIRNVSASIALALAQMMYSKDSKTNQVYASPILIDELLHCFLQAADCRLFKDASPVDGLPALPYPPSRYVSVVNGPKEVSGWTYRLLGYLLSTVRTNITRENCESMSMLWINGHQGVGECRYTTHDYSQAISPAFLIDNYDWKSGEYSTWTESTWSAFSTRIFLRPSKTHEITTLSIGIVVLLISFCLVYIISSRSDVIFEGATSSSDALTAPTAC